MALTTLPFVSLYDLTFEGLKNLNGVLSGLSTPYRIISLSGYGTLDDPRYAAVWAQRPVGAPSQAIERFTGEAGSPAPPSPSQGSSYYPLLVAASGRKGSIPSFAVVFEERPSGVVRPTMRLGLLPSRRLAGTLRPDSGARAMTALLNSSPGTLGEAILQAKQGTIDCGFTGLVGGPKAKCYAYLRCVASYRDANGDWRVAATFLPQPVSLKVDDFVNWTADVADDAEEAQTKFEVFTSTEAGVRLDGAVRIHNDRSVGGDKDGLPRYLQIWQDNILPGGWAMVPDMTEEGYLTAKASYRQSGLSPIRLDVFDDGASKRFTAIFAYSDEPVARTFRKKNKGTKQKVASGQTVAFAAWDGWMKTTLQRNGIRGGQLAVTYNGRLVFYRAYTWAEPSYPDIELDTAINVGSVSKALTGLAALQIVDEQNGPGTSTQFFSGLQSNFWQEMGIASPDPSLGSLRLDQLLTHTSNIQTNYCTEDDDIAIAQGLINGKFVQQKYTLPLSPAHAWTYFSTLGDVDTSNVLVLDTYCYVGINHFLLSRWIERRRKTKGYEAALQKHLFVPIGATLARISASSVVGVGEAIRHRTYPKIEQSHLTDDLRLAHSSYGRRNMDLVGPSGGWTMPASDLTRVVASLAWGTLPSGPPQDAKAPLGATSLGWLQTIRPSTYLGCSAMTPWSVFAANNQATPVTYGSWYRVPWTGSPNGTEWSLAHNGALDGASAQVLQLTSTSSDINGLVGIVLLLNGDLVGSDKEAHRGLTERDFSRGAEGLLGAGIPAPWPSWDLFEED